MTAALVLVVFVSAAEVQAPATTALELAAEEVLGSDAQVRVQGYGAPLDDAQLVAAAPGADAIAEVTWQDAERRRALVHCYIGSSQRVVNRELLFDEADEPRERGRMLGFALASMLPEVRAGGPEPNTQKPDAAPPKAAPAPGGVATRAQAARAAPARAFGAVDATPLGALGLGGPGAGLGVGVSARWFFHRALSLRLAAGVRHGDVPAGQAVSDVLFGGVGVGFQFSSPDPSAAFVFGGRTDALLESYTLRRRASDGAIPERQTQLMPAADLLLEGAWYFWSSAALLAAGGTEFGFGNADVVVHGKEVADIPAFRLVGELGIRARF